VTGKAAFDEVDVQNTKVKEEEISKGPSDDVEASVVSDDEKNDVETSSNDVMSKLFQVTLKLKN